MKFGNEFNIILKCIHIDTNWFMHTERFKGVHLCEINSNEFLFYILSLFFVHFFFNFKIDLYKYTSLSKLSYQSSLDFFLYIICIEKPKLPSLYMYFVTNHIEILLSCTKSKNITVYKYIYGQRPPLKFETNWPLTIDALGDQLCNELARHIYIANGKIEYITIYT